MSSGALAEAETGARLLVDLAALRANYRLFSAKVSPAACGASVKADAYGLGAKGVAPALTEEGCRHFFVAHLSEAGALRGLLAEGAELFVLNGLAAGSESAAAALPGVVPVLNSAEQVAAWGETARVLGRRLPAALQVDTGMARLGVSIAQAEQFARDKSWRLMLDLRLVLSHLSSAEQAGAPSNARQLAACRKLRELFPDVPFSLANSSGGFLENSFHFDVVRPGAALYGINPTPGQPNPMAQVARLQACVIQTRTLPKGASVGYGETFTASGAMPTATIGIGYADGWPRRAQLAAFFEGARLPMIGRISMDLIVLDCSALDEGALRAGDWVELLGEHQTPDEVGVATGTIGYEVIAALGPRICRRLV